MISRHKIRELVLQTLFELDFNEYNTPKDKQLAFDTYKRIGKDELGNSFEENKFAESILDGVLSKKKELDEIIETTAPDWPLETMPMVDRNILRLTLFEILFGKNFETPSKVAINEGIELAKSFGSDGTRRFVNGVFDTVYKNLGPEDTVASSKRLKKSVGALAYGIDGEEIKFAILNDVFGKWTLSKSGLRDEENEKEAVSRVLKEELGLKCRGLKEIGKNKYTARNPEEGPIRNEVTYFLAECDYGKITLKQSGGLKDADWFTLSELEKLPMYKDMKPIILETAKRFCAECQQS